MVVTDVALAEIFDRIAAHRPERGGALYGPASYPLVTHFDFDSDAETTGASYVPSLQLIDSVRRVELETGLKFKGIIHSHPTGITRPSEGDRESASHLFQCNPQLASFAMPIVQTVPPSSEMRSTEFIHWYIAERRSDRPESQRGRFLPSRRDTTPAVEILEDEIHVLPIRQHCEAILTHLREKGLALTAGAGLQSLKLSHAQMVGLVASSRDGHEFMYFVSLDYPVVAPVVLYRTNGNTKSLRHPWDGTSEPEASLELIAELLAKEFGVDSRPPSGEPRRKVRSGE